MCVCVCVSFYAYMQPLLRALRIPDTECAALLLDAGADPSLIEQEEREKLPASARSFLEDYISTHAPEEASMDGGGSKKKKSKHTADGDQDASDERPVVWKVFIEKEMGRRRKKKNKENERPRYFYYNPRTRVAQRERPLGAQFDLSKPAKEAVFGLHFYH